MKLKIYTLYWDAGGYGGGLCVVAANNPEEAIKLAEADSWRVNWEAGVSEIEGAYFEGKPQVLKSEYYQE